MHGLDPFGVEPRFLYLEDLRTGEKVSVPMGAQVPPAGQGSPGRLRLVDEPESKRPSHLVTFVGGLCMGALGVLIVIAAATAT